MLVKIKSSTNPKIAKYIGETRNYFKECNCACLEDLKFPGYGIQTSEILEEKEIGNFIIITTRNSVYALEKIEEENEK